MDAKTLMANFEIIAEAPGGVDGLRELILQLAVQGKLVEQDPNDEPARFLIRRIKDEIDTRPGKNRKETSAVVESNDVPSGWIGCTLGDIYEFAYGKSLPRKERNEKGRFPVYGSNGVVGCHDKALVQKPAVIVGRKGSSGAVNLALEPSWPIDTTYYVLPAAGMSCEFAAITLRSCHLDELDRATAIPGLNREDAYKLPMLLPPLAEQERIVAKVDELMALCDQLQERQERRHTIRKSLQTSALHALTNADSPKALSKAWKRINTNGAILTAHPDSVHPLRQAVLQLAVQGKLVKQNPKDEPSSALLVKAQQERITYSETSKIRYTKSQSVLEDKIPWSAPAGWSWIRLEQVFRVITDGDHQPPPKTDKGIAFLTIGNVSNGKLDFSDTRFVSKGYYDSLAEYRIPLEGDLLYTVVGATFGRPIAVNTTTPFCVQRHIAILKPVSILLLGYARILLASPFVYDQANKSKTGTAQPTIPLRPLRNFIVPLPPYEEQKRIVTRVEELIVYIDNLEASLRKQEKISTRLASATVQSLSA